MRPYHREISPRLAYNLNEIASYFHQCVPKLFHPIQITYEIFAPVSGSPPENVGMSFSGGIDSFFTLHRHLPDQQLIPIAPLTHAVFIHGFDIRLFQGEFYQLVYDRYQKLFNQLGLELIPARTNAYLFSEFRIDWTYTHGAALAGVAHALGKMFKRFYLAAGLNYQYATAVGTNPITDPLFSSESLEIVHDGATHSRLEKVYQVGNWQPLYDNLRVCTYDTTKIDALNCNKCSKCVLTSIMLELAGYLNNYRILKNHLEFKDYLHWVTDRENSFFAKIISREAFNKKRWDIFFPMQMVLLAQWMKNIFYFPIVHRVPRHILYRIKRRIFRYLSEQDHQASGKAT
ncbi:MAG: hypothetical protein ACPL0B_01940 [Anaerolineales bacterium]